MSSEPGFKVNAHRIDPYKNYKFRIIMDNVPVLGVSKVSALKRTTEVIKHRSGGDNSHDHKTPGRTTYDAITLERGITHNIEFEKWANKVHPYDSDAMKDLVNFKKELILEVMNEKGQVALRYNLHRCWVSEFTAIPDLDANGNVIAIESIKIEIEGWTRDTDTPEPTESE
ncbi:MAG: phage tail protein [Candidatus Thorarchaeota archaeon]